jgi:hypothetical protein
MKLKSNKNNNQSSLIDNQLEMPSTSVEKPLQINLFLQNKANFPHFSPENRDFAEKQTQYKPNSNPIKANFGPISRVAEPNKPNSNPMAGKTKMNLSSLITSKYEKINRWRHKNSNPNFILDSGSPCFGVYPRVCLPVVLPGVGDKANL